MNEVINFKETGLHVTDRFVVIPFNNTFTDDKNNRNIHIGEELCKPKALQIIATKAIFAFDKVLENGKFTIPDNVKQETARYFMDCNNVAEFSSLFPIKTFIHKSRYYEEYSKWASINNKEAVSNSQFGKEVLALGYIADRCSFGSERNTYYFSPDFNKSESRIIYDEFLNYNCISEQTDILYNNDPRNYPATVSFSDYLCKYLYKQLTDVNSEYAQNFMSLYSPADNNSNS